MPNLIILESPFWHPSETVRARNIAYAEAAMLDSLQRGESPWLSHITYTRVLNDADPDQRALGINAGLAWGRVADRTVVYTDLGISEGMRMGIERAEREGRGVEFRKGVVG